MLIPNEAFSCELSFFRKACQQNEPGIGISISGLVLD